MTRIPPRLQQLARLYGIQTTYRDMRHKKCEASVESLLAVLCSLGAEVRQVDDVDRGLATRRREIRDRAIEPVIVAWDGKLPPISSRYTLILEGGGVLKTGQRIPMGYHRLIAGQSHEAMVISAPMKAFFPSERREWGVFAPMYALHSKRNPNAGDITDFAAFSDSTAGYGGRVAATLPLLATFLDKPFEPSPYSPASRLFWNEFYLDVGGRRGPATSHTIDYRNEMRARRSILEKETLAFFKHNGEERKRFDAFIQQESELPQYARFRAVTEKQQRGWSSWPARLQSGDFTAADYDKRSERYHLFAQWRIQEDLRLLAAKARQRGRLLYLDLPLGLHPDSYDIWRYRDEFILDAAGGAPPDPVFTQGQNWGFPPMHPEQMRLHGYDYMIAYLRNHFRYARLLRIDHVMGLHRLFWIPRGFPASQGVYVEYPANELYAVLSLESHRYEAGIVGENLGTVPPEVNKSMRRHNVQQMYVLQYEVVGDNPKRALRSVPSNTVASLNTHDMPPFRAFVEGTDIGDRIKLKFLNAAGGKLERRQRAKVVKMLIEFFQHKRLLQRGTKPTPADIFKAASEFLAASAARVVLINLEDIWGETLPQNVPATNKERPNWRRRVKLSIEQIDKDTNIAAFFKLVDQRRSG